MIGQTAALANAVAWAASNVVVKTISGTVRPVPVSAVHTLATALTLIVLTAGLGRMDDLFSMPIEPLSYLVASAIANTAGQITFLYAISLGAVGWTFTMTNSIFIPLSVIAGWLFLGDDVNAWTWVGGGAIMIGLFLLNRPADTLRRPPGSTASRNPPAGADRIAPLAVVMAAASGVLWTAGLVLTARGLQNTDLMAAATVRSGIPALLFILWVASRRGSPLKAIPRRTWGPLLLSAAFGLCSLLTWMFALQHTEAGLTAILSSTAPVWALVMGAVFLR
ncbi:MAG: DMT family transporter, partial [Gemmatimonadetes bacterium]|nr:DMT family transporter [Gemmatimonadota bacterium]